MENLRNKSLVKPKNRGAVFAGTALKKKELLNKKELLKRFFTYGKNKSLDVH